MEYGCHLVSVLWVAEIETTGEYAKEADYPFTDKPVELKPKRFRNIIDEEDIRIEFSKIIKKMGFV